MAFFCTGLFPSLYITQEYENKKKPFVKRRGLRAGDISEDFEVSADLEDIFSYYSYFHKNVFSEKRRRFWG